MIEIDQAEVLKRIPLWTKEIGLKANFFIVNKLVETMAKEWRLPGQLPNQPTLMLLGGYQGSGKSEVTTAISQEIPMIIISSDEIRDRINKEGLPWSEEFRHTVNAIRNRLIRRAMKTDSNIALDQNTIPLRLEFFRFLNKIEGGRYKLISAYLNTTRKTLLERVEIRSKNEGKHAGTVDELKLYFTIYGEIDSAPYDLVFDTEKNPPKKIARQLIERIKLINERARGELVSVVDIDNVIIDTDRFKKDAFEAIAKKGNISVEELQKNYERIRKTTDFVNIPILIKRVFKDKEEIKNELLEMISKLSYVNYLQPYALELIAFLQKLGPLVIYSSGQPEEQIKKLKETGIYDLLDNQKELTFPDRQQDFRKKYEESFDGGLPGIVIDPNKNNNLFTFLSILERNKVIYIDDKASLVEASSGQVFCPILIRHGSYGNKYEAQSPKISSFDNLARCYFGVQQFFAD